MIAILHGSGNDQIPINNVIDNPQYASELKNLKEKMLSWYQETCDVVPFKGDERNFN